MTEQPMFPRIKMNSDRFGMSCGHFKTSPVWAIALLLAFSCSTRSIAVADGSSEALLIAQNDSNDPSTPPGMGLFDRLLHERRVTQPKKESEAKSKPIIKKSREETKKIAEKATVRDNAEKAPSEAEKVGEAKEEDTPTLAERFESTSTASPVLQPGLIVRISVFAGDHKELEETEKRVSSSGTLTLPLIGNVSVTSMTITQVSQLLQERYSKFLRDPVVDVELVLGEEGETLYPWGYVTILGRVKNPGRVRIPPTQDLSLSMGVQLAGGFDTSAKATDIQVTRQMGKDERKTLQVNLKEVGSDGNSAEDILLQPGDIVYIPERIL